MRVDCNYWNKERCMFDKVKILTASMDLMKSIKGKVSIGDCWRLIKLAYQVWKWFRKANADKKITWDEWTELIKTVIAGIGASTLGKMLNGSGRALVIGDSRLAGSIYSVFKMEYEKQEGVSTMDNEAKTTAVTTAATGNNIYEVILEAIKWGADAGKDHALTVGELHYGTGLIIEKLGLKDKPVIKW